MISSWCTEAAPCRWAVPRQSAPVSPPPMMMTRFPLAVMGEAPSAPSRTRFDGFRYSRARCTPDRATAGDREVTGQGGPAGQHHRIELCAHVGGRAHPHVGRARRAEAALFPGFDGTLADGA